MAIHQKPVKLIEPVKPSRPIGPVEPESYPQAVDPVDKSESTTDPVDQSAVDRWIVWRFTLNDGRACTLRINEGVNLSGGIATAKNMIPSSVTAEPVRSSGGSRLTPIWMTRPSVSATCATFGESGLMRDYTSTIWHDCRGAYGRGCIIEDGYQPGIGSMNVVYWQNFVQRPSPR